MKSLCLVLVCLLGAASLPAKEKPAMTYVIPLPPQPDFSPLAWLIGEWTGKTTGRGPQGEIRLSVTFALEKRFMILREEVSLAPTKAAPASSETWMGILSAHRSGPDFVLQTFSSTGFITRYRVTAQGTGIHFNPEGGEQPPPGWIFRRVIQRSGESEFKETVQVAPPNKPFFDYYTAKLTRVTAP